MLLEADRKRAALSDLTTAIARDAAAHDADGSFPTAAFAQLARRGLLEAPPVGAEEMRPLLRLLAAVGRGDLSVGRIFEGHVNAVWLVRRFGTPAQVRELAGAGGTLGVWNTDIPDDPLRIAGGRFEGRKSFASGIDGLSRAIVTVGGEEGRRMYLVPTGALGVDRGWWRPLGMRASGSHVADFSGLAVDPGWALGGPDDYGRQPWFSAGAIRFLAVQVGGMHALFDTAASHLAKTGRAGNPYQAHRLARMGVAVETGYLWLDRTADAWTEAARADDPAAARHLLGAANGARVAVEEAALRVLEEAERAIGAAGMIAPHPFERQMRDLRTYLRQPNPDGAAAAFGAAIADGDWAPLGQGHAG